MYVSMFSVLSYDLVRDCLISMWIALCPGAGELTGTMELDISSEFNPATFKTLLASYAGVSDEQIVVADYQSAHFLF